jgi:aldose sugar dehydrogenase
MRMLAGARPPVRPLLLPLVLPLVLAAGLTSAPATTAQGAPARTGAEAARAAAPAAEVDARPALRVTRLATGLSQPWDVQPIGRRQYLVTERDTRRLFLIRKGRRSQVRFPSSSVWASGETGLMSLEVDPRFRDNRRFYTCQGATKRNGRHEVRVVAWRLGREGRGARRIEILLGGIQATSGRHGGCRLLVARSGALLVGTGDAAVGTNPRDLRSLNGKVLRLDRRTGRPWKSNPFAGAANRRKRFVLTYGHRNVQGLAQRRDGSVWSVEHGPSRDDEINRLRRGGDYGWHPVPGYDEQVPMTDHDLPGPQVSARWRSGSPTIATSGATWVYGDGWGSLRGTLAVAALKGSRLVFMKFDSDGRHVSNVVPARLREFGRLRSVSRAPNGDLLVTTANGSNDAVLRVSPR